MAARTAGFDRPEFKALALLRHGPLLRGPRGWRFGIARVGDVVVERLIAAGMAVRKGDLVELAQAEAR